MSLGLLLVAIIGTFFAGRRSLGMGIAALLACGYFNGLIRANYLSIYTTLMFDGALCGLYVSQLTTVLSVSDLQRRHLHRWVVALLAWPTLLFAIPVHHPLIQLVGWRAEVIMLPLILLGSRLHTRELQFTASAIAVLNLLALAAGIYIYQRGIGALYPRNIVTELMYRSTDIAGGYARIPSTFLSAHSYGGAMLQSLPFLIAGITEPSHSLWRRGLLICGVAAAIAGLIMCGARQPIALLVIASLLSWYRSGRSVQLMLAVSAVSLATIAVAASNPRLQRFFELRDPELLVARLGASSNQGVFTLIASHPLGAGLGAGAPSIPYFLKDIAPPAIMAENEFARMAVNVGWIGIALWLAFLAWLLLTPSVHQGHSSFGWLSILSYGTVPAVWLTGMIGVGVLVSIPSSSLMLLGVGILSQRPVSELHRTQSVRLQQWTSRTTGTLSYVRSK